MTSSPPPLDVIIISNKLTVIEPIGDRRNCDSALENILIRTQNHCRHISAVAPAREEQNKHDIKCLLSYVIMIVEWIIIIWRFLSFYFWCFFLLLPSHTTRQSTVRMQWKTLTIPTRRLVNYRNFSCCSTGTWWKIKWEDVKRWAQIGFHVMCWVLSGFEQTLLQHPANYDTIRWKFRARQQQFDGVALLKPHVMHSTFEITHWHCANVWNYRASGKNLSGPIETTKLSRMSVQRSQNKRNSHMKWKIKITWLSHSRAL